VINRNKKIILGALISAVILGVTLSPLYFIINNNYSISNNKKSDYKKDKKDVRKYNYWDHFRVTWGDLIF
jgi:hypothetical protein